MFENDHDMAVFLDGVREEVERERVELHAFTLMATHFHFLVRTLGPSLSDAMQAIQLPYVRHFNRSRRRDGSLVRGRFWSRRVDSEAYRRVLVGYIDANPVEARVARSTVEYRYGSARHYALSTNGPEWLCRRWVEAEVCRTLATSSYDPSRYAEVFGRGFPSGVARWMDTRPPPCGGVGDPTDSLLAGAAPAVLDWMQNKARLADGCDVGWQLVPAGAVLAVRAPNERLRGRRLTWKAAGHALLLRMLAGLPFDRIAGELGCGRETARRLAIAGQEELDRCPEFAAWVSEAGYLALTSVYGGAVGRAPS